MQSLKNLEKNEGMQLNVKGKLNNMRLAPHQSLYPIFEAVVNSLQSIEQSGNIAGEIRIKLYRDQQTTTEENVPRTIQSVEITDNGLGFISDNRLSFKKSDSTYKSAIGGKGVGRFSWLKVFSSANVSSVFEENGEWKTYSLKFVNDQNPFKDEIFDRSKLQIRKTTVSLISARSEYHKYLQHDLESLIFQIGAHILPYILQNKTLKIIIEETDQEGKVFEKNLTSFFRRDYLHEIRESSFIIKDENFKLTALIINRKINKLSNTLNFCAHQRIVTSALVKKYIPDFSSNIFKNTLEESSVVILVNGRFLDDNVIQERVEFNIPYRKNEEDELFITMDEIIESTNSVIKNIFKNELDKIRLYKLSVLSEIIRTQYQQYRFLINHAKDFIDNFQLDPVSQIEQQLFQVSHEIKTRVRKNAKKVLSKKRLDNASNYNQQLSELVTALNEIADSTLVEYVAHKQVIINCLEKIMEWSSKGKFETEDQLHRLIFDTSVTSDEAEVTNQNLWIIDERLAYHNFLTSDKAVGIKKERPDILIGNLGSSNSAGNFDAALAYSSSKITDPMSSIVIIEFKRPGKESFGKNDHPHLQVMRYIAMIRRGEVKVGGRPIKLFPACLFTCYIICDLSKSTVEEFKTIYNYRDTPDGRGLVLWTDQNVQIEVIPLDKLLSDALKRNQMLFEKANIPC